MNGRIDDKIKEVENLLLELEQIRVDTLEKYVKDIKTKAACERYIEKVMEAVIDLAFLVIREKELKEPESDEGVLEVLMNEGIIGKDLYSKLKNAKGMRNFIIHQYEKVDDVLVFTAVEEEIVRDVSEFLEVIK